MRLTSEFWVQAYLRKVLGTGAFAGLRKRGAREAGAIFIVIDRLDRSFDLYGPAPQSSLETDEHPGSGGRHFEHVRAGLSQDEIAHYLEKQLKFDQDLWIVEVEDAEGRSFLDDA